jgi:3-deoxy-manno-octulosonate cytidylyltransferase (CMP-KDO synthetase)
VRRPPIAVIPARYAATRFPGKPLARLLGKSMVEHVYARCLESGAFARVIVATEDSRIEEVVRAFGGEVVMTSPACPSGTDRVAEVARSVLDAECWVNVQGDEPTMHPDSLRTLAGCFADPTVQMATLVRPLEENERSNPNVVKAVLTLEGDALYFSRADVPHAKEPSAGTVRRWGHLGLYAYRRDTLLRLAALSPTPLEESEKLEQLRALENGMRIRCLFTPHTGLGVDVPEDIPRAEALLRTRG